MKQVPEHASTVNRTDGGYDQGYANCPMFWPDRPGSLLVLAERDNLLQGGRAVDLGCGEGTNAVWLSERGYDVQAMDVSQLALANAERKYPESRVRWQHRNACQFEPTGPVELTVLYGLLHCLREDEIITLLTKVKAWTAPGGLAIVVAFNDRSQDLEQAHPGFFPTLLPHTFYIHAFKNWTVLHSTDKDLYESHPNNNIPHHHSMTRIIARHTQ